jgi:hypothetical protein
MGTEHAVVFVYVFRQYSFFRPQLPDRDLRILHANYPPLPGLRQVAPQQEHVCAAIACDIDHTLINQAMTVSPLGGLPSGFPDIPKDMMDVDRVRQYSLALLQWITGNARYFQVTWFDRETGPPRRSPRDFLVAINKVCEHARLKRAIIVAPEVRCLCHPAWLSALALLYLLARLPAWLAFSSCFVAALRMQWCNLHSITVAP